MVAASAEGVTVEVGGVVGVEGIGVGVAIVVLVAAPPPRHQVLFKIDHKFPEELVAVAMLL